MQRYITRPQLEHAMDLRQAGWSLQKITNELNGVYPMLHTNLGTVADNLRRTMGVTPHRGKTRMDRAALLHEQSVPWPVIAHRLGYRDGDTARGTYYHRIRMARRKEHANSR